MLWTIFFYYLLHHRAHPNLNFGCVKLGHTVVFMLTTGTALLLQLCSAGLSVGQHIGENLMTPGLEEGQNYCFGLPASVALRQLMNNFIFLNSSFYIKKQQTSGNGRDT